jgi:carboxyl-terminal processing protease
MKKIFYLFLLLSTVGITSCKKDKKVTPNPSALDLIKDSVFLYTKETYYWNKSLPSYEAFKPRAFSGTNDLDALSTEVDALSQYAINP